MTNWLLYGHLTLKYTERLNPRGSKLTRRGLIAVVNVAAQFHTPWFEQSRTKTKFRWIEHLLELVSRRHPRAMIKA